MPFVDNKPPSKLHHRIHILIRQVNKIHEKIPGQNLGTIGLFLSCPTLYTFFDQSPHVKSMMKQRDCQGPGRIGPVSRELHNILSTRAQTEREMTLG